MSGKKNSSTFMRSARDLLRLSGPLIMGQVAVIGMTVTDIYMVGQVSADDLAAVQLAGSIWSIVSMFLIGIMLGNNPIIGQYFGAGKTDQVRYQFQQVVWMSIPLGLLMVGGVFLGIYVLNILDISEAVFLIARGILYPYMGTAFMLSIFFAFRSTFEGVGDTRPVMVFNMLAFVLNAVLDYLLVFGELGFPKMGGVGAGWATLTVMVFLLTSVSLYAKHAKTLKYLRLYQDFVRPNLKSIAETLKLGIPSALLLTAEFSFFSVIPLFIAHLGSEVVGAHAIAINVDAIAFMIPLGISQGLTIAVAHTLGRDNARKARHLSLTGFKLVFILALAIACFKLAFRHELAAFFSPDPQVQALAASLLLFAAVLGSLDCIQISAGGALRGYKDARIPLFLQIFAFWVIAFPIAYSLALTNIWGEPLGVYGFWVGMIIAVVFANLFLLARWNSVSRKALSAVAK